jgi:NAD-dependent dihydropyrimidine dehydrogenase PreA subunit
LNFKKPDNTFKHKIGEKMVEITIDYDKCDGEECAECVDACPMEVFIIDNGKIIVQNIDECSVCEVCMDVCLNEAVKVQE